MFDALTPRLEAFLQFGLDVEAERPQTVGDFPVFDALPCGGYICDRVRIYSDEHDDFVFFQCVNGRWWACDGFHTLRLAADAPYYGVSITDVDGEADPVPYGQDECLNARILMSEYVAALARVGFLRRAAQDDVAARSCAAAHAAAHTEDVVF